MTTDEADNEAQDAGERGDAGPADPTTTQDAPPTSSAAEAPPPTIDFIRQARDGTNYTHDQFIEWCGETRGVEMWNEAIDREVLPTGDDIVMAFARAMPDDILLEFA